MTGAKDSIRFEEVAKSGGRFSRERFPEKLYICYGYCQ
jgi:hypothetical protein